MNNRQRNLVSAALLLAAPLHAAADETVRLLCNFQYGQIEVNVNYTRGTVNGATAMVDDKEIVWTPAGSSGELAVINRYSGIMKMSKGRKEFTGMCNQVVDN
jgi:hypothetical protein